MKKTERERERLWVIIPLLLKTRARTRYFQFYYVVINYSARVLEDEAQEEERKKGIILYIGNWQFLFGNELPWFRSNWSIYNLTRWEGILSYIYNFLLERVYIPRSFHDDVVLMSNDDWWHQCNSLRKVRVLCYERYSERSFCFTEE